MENKMIRVFIDSEWGSLAQFLIMPVLVVIDDRQLLFLVYNESYPLLKSEFKVSMIPKEVVFCGFIIYEPDTNHLIKILEPFASKKGCNVEVNFFFCFGDLCYLFGFKNLRVLIRDKQPKNRYTPYIIQDKKIRGQFPITTNNGFILNVTLHDYYGYTAGQKSLKELLTVLNIGDLDKKDLCKDYMSTLEIMAGDINLVENFINYSINDVISLVNVRKAYITNFNNILKTIGLDESYLFDQKTTPRSFGSTVSKLVEKVIYNYFDFDLKLFKKVNQEISINHIDEVSNIITGASVKTLLNLHPQSTGLFNGIVSGGRNINEQPDLFYLENVADADLVGCYGTALNSYNYPLGLPTVHAHRLFDPLEKDIITLKEFLSRNSGELVPGLFTITVSGKLSFEQDLIYSKIVSPTTIKTALLKTEESDPTSISGDFVLLRKEIINGIITWDILEAIKKIATLSELKEFYALKVVTAIYYKKSLFIENPSDYIKLMEKEMNDDDYKYDGVQQTMVDMRPRFWTIIPMSTFIEPLMTKRAEYKRIAKIYKEKFDISKNIIEQNIFNEYEALQRFFKNVINTVYGVIASIYFRVSNVILANNITAKARLNVYMMKIVLQGTQSITDGTIYSPEKVLYLIKSTRKLPGFNTLADKTRLLKHRSVKLIPFKNDVYDWKYLYQQKFLITNIIGSQRYDDEITQHVKTFWLKYGLTFDFEIEHKPEHTGTKLFFLKKAHYSIKTFKKGIVYKFRGLSEINNKNNMYYKLADYIFLEGEKNWQITENDLLYQESRLSTCNDYLKLSSNSKMVLQPGTRINTMSIFKLNTDDMIVNTLKQHKNKSRKDYALMLLTNEPSDVFNKRFRDYKKRLKRSN